MRACRYWTYTISVHLLLFLFVQGLPGQAYQRTELQIPVRDGKVLAADLHRPGGEVGPWPVILMQTPYDRTAYRLGFLARNPANPLLASRRYAFLIVDWRGFFGSRDAAYSGAPSRGEDGYDLVEWAAAQTWSSGAVGTWGASALGQVQLETALEQPPSLKAAVPMVCHLGESYEFWFRGGVYFKNRNDFVSDYYQIGDVYRNNPYKNQFWIFVESQVRSLEGISTPMLFQSGWYDIETSFTMETFERLRAAQRAQGLHHSAMLIGPWGHSHMGESEQGSLTFPDAEFADVRAALDFFDHHLLGVEKELFPGYSTYRLNAGTWNQTDQWPPQASPVITLHLGQGGRLLEQASEAASATLVSNPLTPAPTLFGTMLQDTPLGKQGPGDLSPLIGRPDTVLFQTELLHAPIVVEGVADLRLTLTCDTPDVDVFARLVHIRPDGQCIYLADGVKRASLRSSYSEPSFLQPDVSVEVDLTLTPLSAEIPAGHRLGLFITCSNSDLFEVNPQDGNSYIDDAGAILRSANVELRLGVGSDSFLTVPTLTTSSSWVLF